MNALHSCNEACAVRWCNCFEYDSAANKVIADVQLP